MSIILLVTGLLGAALAVAILGGVIHQKYFTIGGLANSVSDGVHEDGRVTLALETTLTARGLFVTGGGAGDRPLGAVWDEGAAGDTVGVELIGGAAKTRLGLAGAAIVAYQLVTVGAGGKAVPLPAAAGTYWVIGESLTAAAADEPFEFAPAGPYQVTVGE
jgi:hypothetical protein